MKLANSESADVSIFLNLQHLLITMLSAEKRPGPAININMKMMRYSMGSSLLANGISLCTIKNAMHMLNIIGNSARR